MYIDIHVYRHQMEECNKDLARLFSVEPNDGTRGHGKKMKHKVHPELQATLPHCEGDRAVAQVA